MGRFYKNQTCHPDLNSRVYPHSYSWEFQQTTPQVWGLVQGPPCRDMTRFSSDKVVWRRDICGSHVHTCAYPLSNWLNLEHSGCGQQGQKGVST